MLRSKQDRSLKTSVLLSIIFLSMATLAVVLIGSDYRNHKLMLSHSLQLIERDIAMLRRQNDEDLALYGWDAATRNLNAYGQSPEVLQVAIVDSTMKARAASPILGPAALPHFKPEQARHAVALNKLVTDIDLDHQHIGAYSPHTIPSHRLVAGESATGVTYLLYDLAPQARQLRKELLMQALLFCGVGALALLAMLVHVRNTITRPLTQLARGAVRMAGGHYNLRLEEQGYREIHKLASALNQFAQATSDFQEDSNRRHARLNSYLQSGVVGMLVVDPEGRIQEMNRVLTDITGYGQEELFAEIWLELCHPEDRKRLLALWRRLLAKPGQERALEFRLCDRDGKIHWVEAVAKYEQGIGEQSGNVLVFLWDVTLKKQSEEDLRLAAAAFNTHEAIVITDAQGRILKVNQSFTEITGFTAEEVLGKDPSLLQSGRHDKAFYQRMWRQIQTNGIWQGEIYNRRKNGEIYPEYETIMAVKNNRGDITQYIAFFEDITQRKNAEQKIQQLAYYDDLTQLPNRRLLNERLQQAIASAKRHQRLGALLFIDLDHFKDVNDSLGHLVGDQLLHEVAQRLALHTRQEDTLSRLGGDEFVLLVHCLEDPRDDAAEQIRQLGDRIIEDISRPYCIDGHNLHISVSIGISFFPEDSDNLTDLIRQADTAMYQSKDAGRGVVRFFSEDMQHRADRRLLMRNDLRKALQLEEFELYFQPQIDVKTGRLVGAECLLRWYHPKQGFIPPSDFIPTAEENGVIVEIGEWVLRNACQRLQQLQQNCTDQNCLQLAVNISPLQFHRRDFVATVKAIIEQYDIDPRCLCFELTEGLLVQNIDQAVDVIRELKGIGIGFAIDDFGTGYSSLGYLSRLPLDKIKVDKSFIDMVPDNPQGITVVETILSMSQHLGVDVIAEGVENREQLNFLTQRYCHAYQGYYAAKPMPFSQYLSYIESTKECTYAFPQREEQ